MSKALFIVFKCLDGRTRTEPLESIELQRSAKLTWICNWQVEKKEYDRVRGLLGDSIHLTGKFIEFVVADAVIRVVHWKKLKMETDGKNRNFICNAAVEESEYHRVLTSLNTKIN